MANNTPYLVVGTIDHDRSKLFGDPQGDSGPVTITYLPEGILTDEEIARMERDGFLQLPGEALGNAAMAAHLEQVQAELAAAKAALAAQTPTPGE